MKSIACTLKPDIETPEMRAMNKHNRGVIEICGNRHINRVRELQAS